MMRFDWLVYEATASTAFTVTPRKSAPAPGASGLDPSPPGPVRSGPHRQSQPFPPAHLVEQRLKDFRLQSAEIRGASSRTQEWVFGIAWTEIQMLPFIVYVLLAASAGDAVGHTAEAPAHWSHQKSGFQPHAPLSSCFQGLHALPGWSEHVGEIHLLDLARRFAAKSADC